MPGLGETYLMLAQRYLARCLIGLATDTCQQAIVCLTRYVHLLHGCFLCLQKGSGLLFTGWTAVGYISIFGKRWTEIWKQTVKISDNFRSWVYFMKIYRCTTPILIYAPKQTPTHKEKRCKKKKALWSHFQYFTWTWPCMSDVSCICVMCIFISAISFDAWKVSCLLTFDSFTSYCSYVGHCNHFQHVVQGSYMETWPVLPMEMVGWWL